MMARRSALSSRTAPRIVERAKQPGIGEHAGVARSGIVEDDVRSGAGGERGVDRIAASGRSRTTRA